MSFNVNFLTTAGENYFKKQAKNKKIGQLSDEQMEVLYHDILITELIVRDYKTINYENNPKGARVLSHPLQTHVEEMVLELHSKTDLVALQNSRSTKKTQKTNTRTQDTQTNTNNKNTKTSALRNFANS